MSEICDWFACVYARCDGCSIAGWTSDEGPLNGKKEHCPIYEVMCISAKCSRCGGNAGDGVCTKTRQEARGADRPKAKKGTSALPVSTYRVQFTVPSLGIIGGSMEIKTEPHPMVWQYMRAEVTASIGHGLAQGDVYIEHISIVEDEVASNDGR